jgi:hypothetical protein
MEAVFKVRCHGETETVRISRYDMMDGMAIEPGTAFATKRIAA